MLEDASNHSFRDHAAAKGPFNAPLDLVDLQRLGCTVTLPHEQRQLGSLVGGEPLIAVGARATTSDLLTGFGRPAVNDLGVICRAKRTPHLGESTRKRSHVSWREAATPDRGRSDLHADR